MLHIKIRVLTFLYQGCDRFVGDVRHPSAFRTNDLQSVCRSGDEFVLGSRFAPLALGSPKDLRFHKGIQRVIYRSYRYSFRFAGPLQLLRRKGLRQGASER